MRHHAMAAVRSDPAGSRSGMSLLAKILFEFDCGSSSAECGFAESCSGRCAVRSGGKSVGCAFASVYVLLSPRV